MVKVTKLTADRCEPVSEFLRAQGWTEREASSAVEEALVVTDDRWGFAVVAAEGGSVVGFTYAVQFFMDVGDDGEVTQDLRTLRVRSLDGEAVGPALLQTLRGAAESRGWERLIVYGTPEMLAGLDDRWTVCTAGEGYAWFAENDDGEMRPFFDWPYRDSDVLAFAEFGEGMRGFPFPVPPRREDLPAAVAAGLAEAAYDWMGDDAPDLIGKLRELVEMVVDDFEGDADADSELDIELNADVPDIVGVPEYTAAYTITRAAKQHRKQWVHIAGDALGLPDDLAQEFFDDILFDPLAVTMFAETPTGDIVGTLVTSVHQQAGEADRHTLVIDVLIADTEPTPKWDLMEASAYYAKSRDLDRIIALVDAPYVEQLEARGWSAIPEGHGLVWQGEDRAQLFSITPSDHHERVVVINWGRSHSWTYRKPLSNYTATLREAILNSVAGEAVGEGPFTVLL